MPEILTTCTPMQGGVDPVSGVGQIFQFTLGGTWDGTDRLTLTLVDVLSGVTTTVGASEDTNGLTGKTPTFGFTFKGKLYIAAGSGFYFSDSDAPTTFVDPEGAGNGYVMVNNQNAAPESITALCSYQGKLAVFTNNMVQIWNTDANPLNYALGQTLTNIGTFAPLSVQSLGDLDVFFLSYTGIRSLRVRDSSNNAIVTDVGSPIDALVKAKLIACTNDAQRAAACGIVEPGENRYWLFLKDTIYVLSYFPSSKIVAWSEYAPTYNSSGTQTAFVPQRMLVANGKIYLRDANAVYAYGGSDGNTYDACSATVETPWLDLKKPATWKQFTGIDYSMDAAWSLSVSCDYIGTLTWTEAAASQSAATYDKGKVGLAQRGTHIKLKATCAAASASKLSAMIIHFNEGNAK